ncbi:DUF262 domain-containing protein [Cronobacter dublinensis]|uniref:DUF262 domain-containing protein n=1 Tax=Cronobacter dublinensis TaxID=413497 RepID=UPI000CFC5356|nr:DUF262 domain-containing protein [Cronobacter dublinensis]MDI7397788.1 DUF262 domain-containing protein [Cronobacter dublinensis]
MSIVRNVKVESRDIKWISDNFKSGELIIDNSFQRRYVWIKKDKISLIESILMGYPIPEVYLWQNKTDPETGKRVHSIVDGQQRLGAVFDYVSEQFSLEKKHLEYQDANFSGKKFSELEDDQKAMIWGYDFSIRFINNSITINDIKNLFLRLNRTNTTLNPQELRNAEFNGEFIKLADQISNHSFWKDYNIFNNTDLRRMLDIQFISTILIFIRMGIAEETSQSAINKIYDQYNDEYPEAEEDKELFMELLNVLNFILKGKKNLQYIAKRKTHFYTLFTLSFYIYRIKLDSATNYQYVSTKLEEWFAHYKNETNFENDTVRALLDEYRLLSQEGVQKKANRQRRLDILKEYLSA